MSAMGSVPAVASGLPDAEAAVPPACGERGRLQLPRVPAALDEAVVVHMVAESAPLHPVGAAFQLPVPQAERRQRVVRGGEAGGVEVEAIPRVGLVARRAPVGLTVDQRRGRLGCVARSRAGDGDEAGVARVLPGPKAAECTEVVEEAVAVAVVAVLQLHHPRAVLWQWWHCYRSSTSCSQRWWGGRSGRCRRGGRHGRGGRAR